jgi:hypothetical protein
MNKSLQKLVVVLASAVLSFAVIEAKPVKAGTFTFKQTGFFNISPLVPQPMPMTNAVLQGTFIGEDLDDDQTIKLGELTDFSVFFPVSSFLNFVVDLEELYSFEYNLTSMDLAFSGGMFPIKSITVSPDRTFIGRKTGTLPELAESTVPIVVTQVLPQPVPESGLVLALSLFGFSALLKPVIKRFQLKKIQLPNPKLSLTGGASGK